MKKLLILVLTNIFILTLILLGKPAKAQTTTITGQFLYDLQLYVLPEKQTPPNYSTAIYSSTIDENDFITSGLYQNWLQPRLPDGISGYIYLVDSTHTIKNVYLGGGYLEQGQVLSYPYEPSIEMKHYNAPLISLFLLNPVNKFYFETPTLDYIVYYESNDGTTPRIKLIDATSNENDYNRVKLSINGYDTGYNAGYSVGYENGQNNGYESGYQDGQNNGYNTGYNAGQYDFYNEYYQQIYDDGYNAGLGDRQLGVNTIVNFNQLVPNNDISSSNLYYDTRTYLKFSISLNVSPYTSIVRQDIYNIGNYNYIFTTSTTGNYRVFHDGESQNIVFLSSFPMIENNIYLLTIDFTSLIINQSNGIKWENFNIYNLTQIYGIGHEPSTNTDFKNDFPSTFYEYTESKDININYENGYVNGKNDGFSIGYDDGKSYQATQQLTSDGWIKNIFTGIGAFLALEILPGVSIGLIVGIPFIITVAWFVLKMARGGSSE